MREVQSDIVLQSLTSLKAGVIRTLLYFDIFNYPLTEEEIIQYHPVLIKEGEIAIALSGLIENKFVFENELFFSVQPDPYMIGRRKRGNKLAADMLPVARKYSKLIFGFPFVQAVMLSGSMSKNYMDKESDIDYFIVTEPGRLWLVRGLLALYRRAFLFNSHKFFCTNYFVDTQSLEIEEKNIYTAFETATLNPIYGRELYQQFYSKNTWLKMHLPNHTEYQASFTSEEKGFLKRAGEKMLSGKLGERLDLLVMWLAVRKWNAKYSNSFLPAEFDIAFKSKKNVSKGHPQFFQKKVLEQFEQKIRQFEVHHSIKLSHE